ncbi:MAG: CYTH domain-containing protein [Oscillospiraceae bacterium]|nr:CYTH domain-containing protein [Oscillospiraceae bacterium]
MATEFELKYGATEDTLAAIDAAYTETPTRYQMQTTYYDTPSHALSERHITLRRRMENDISVCTLKAPAKLGRAEFELECDSIEKALPELCKLSSIDPALLAEGIVPVCGARFTRLARTLTVPGATVELALDNGVLLGGGKELPLCEVEVELKVGIPTAAAAFAVQLATAYGLQPESKSKFARAIALAKGE